MKYKDSIPRQLAIPFACSLLLNFILVFAVPQLTFIKPRKSRRIYAITDLFRIPVRREKKEEMVVKKQEKTAPLPEDVENINRNAKAPPAEEQVYEPEDLDEMPRVILMGKPEYPEELRLKGIEGRVVLKFMINFYGFVENIALLEKSPHEPFNQAAITAVRKWQFSPPKIGGSPASVWFVVPIRYELE